MPPRTVKPKLDDAPAALALTDATSAMNLRVLRKEDDAIERIVAHSKHAVLYGFDADARQWARKNVEGALFVVRRATEPRDAFVVLNRCGTENLRQRVGGAGFELERSPPYLMYRVGREVNGIWFHDAEECEAMSAVLEGVLAEARARGEGNEVGSETRTTTEAGARLFASATTTKATSAPTGGDLMAQLMGSVSIGNGARGSESVAPTRVLQPPRKITGTSASAPRTKSVAKSAPPTTSSALNPAAVRAAMSELIEDDEFIGLITRALAKHA